jgi:hypothetical protein
MDGYIESLDRLRGLSIGEILKAHDFRGAHSPPSYSRRGKEEVNQYIEDCYKIANMLNEAIENLSEVDMEAPVLKIYDRIIDHMPKDMNFKYSGELDVPILFSAMGIYFKLCKMK